MKCSEVQCRLSAYLDGELQQALADEIKAHLACCEECRKGANELNEVYDILSAWRAPEPQIALTFAKPVIKHRNAIFRWMAAAACIAGFLAGGFIGNILWNNSKLTSDSSPANEIITSWNLDVLDDWTRDSVEAVYMNLASLNREVSNNE